MSLEKTLLVTVAALALTSSAHAATFNLGSVPVGTTLPLSLTAGGVTATFTSPAGNGFMTENVLSLLDFAPQLFDFNSFGTDNLTISFSTPVSGNVVIPFAIQDAFGANAPDNLSVVASNGQTFTVGTTTSPLVPNEPEGTVNFVTAGAISSLTLSSSIAFAIGNVNVPEPMSIALLGTGLIGLAAASRRRSR